MPDGMVALFEGKYFWKMPGDVEMDVGPTRRYPMPITLMPLHTQYDLGIRAAKRPSPSTPILRLAMQLCHGLCPLRESRERPS
jgi:hypothetical protein